MTFHHRYHLIRAPKYRCKVLVSDAQAGDDAEALVDMDLPLDWDEQRFVLGMAV